MPENTIYQLDLAALRGYSESKWMRFKTPDVVITMSPRWSATLETMTVAVASITKSDTNTPFAIVPCDWLTPNPAPTFRFIVTAANGNRISDDTVQGIPREYADYAPILLREGFEWVGINYGSQRVSIERVFPPLGESSDS